MKSGMSAAPVLLTEPGASFGDGTFQPGCHVTIHGVNNLEEGLRAKVFAWAPEQQLYVVKDAAGATWGAQSRSVATRQTMWIANCPSSETPVRARKMVVAGRCGESVSRGLAREMSRKKMAMQIPTAVACVSGV